MTAVTIFAVVHVVAVLMFTASVLKLRHNRNKFLKEAYYVIGFCCAMCAASMMVGAMELPRYRQAFSAMAFVDLLALLAVHLNYAYPRKQRP